MFLAFFLWLGLFLFAVLDCLAADPARCRGLPKLVWIPVIALLPIVGPSAWLMFGRPLRLREGKRPAPRPRGPEDDPRFLEITGGPARNAPPKRTPEAAELPEVQKPSSEERPPAQGETEAANEHGVNSLSRWEADLLRREEELRRKLGDLPPDQH